MKREELEYHIISDEDLYEEKVYLKNQADKVMDDLEAKIKNLEKANAELIKLVQGLEDENNELENETKHLDDMVDAYQKSEALDIAKMDKKDERIKELEEQCTKYQAELMNNDPALNPAISKMETAAPKWISVNEKLPPEGTHIIAFSPQGVFPAYYESYANKDFAWWINGMPVCNVTHWMKLPEPPTTEDSLDVVKEK